MAKTREPKTARRPLKGIKLRPSGAIDGKIETFEELYKIMRWDVRPKSSKRSVNFVRKPPTESEVLAALRPYAEAMGQANLEWNKLQQWLSNCFYYLFHPQGEEALAVWDTLTSDRVQRQVLIEAAKVKFIARSYNPTFADEAAIAAYEIFDCIDFLVVSATKFEDLRNNAIHAPLQVNIAPEHFLVYVDDQHNRGMSLKNKMHQRNTSIIDELVFLRKSLRTLNKFASSFWHAWVKGQTLPEIPRLPTLVPRQTRKRSSHPSAPK